MSAPDLKEWHMDIAVLDNPLYPPTESYRLRLRFDANYPMEAPETVFITCTACCRASSIWRYRR